MRLIAPLLFSVVLLACASKEPARNEPRPTPTSPPRKSQVDEDCMQRCMTRNAMRSVGAEQIEYDCELDCRVR